MHTFVHTLFIQRKQYFFSWVEVFFQKSKWLVEWNSIIYTLFTHFLHTFYSAHKVFFFLG